LNIMLEHVFSKQVAVKTNLLALKVFTVSKVDNVHPVL